MNEDDIILINPEDDPIIEEEGIKDQKRVNKIKALETLKVVQNNVPFDANEPAQNNMTSVLAIANWQFNKNISTTLELVANDPNTDDVTKAMLLGLSNIFNGLYNNIYKQKIFWKGADNKAHNVEAETVAKALYKAMQMKAQVIQQNS